MSQGAWVILKLILLVFAYPVFGAFLTFIKALITGEEIEEYGPRDFVCFSLTWPFWVSVSLFFLTGWVIYGLFAMICIGTLKFLCFFAGMLKRFFFGLFKLNLPGLFRGAFNMVREGIFNLLERIENSQEEISGEKEKDELDEEVREIFENLDLKSEERKALEGNSEEFERYLQDKA